MNAREKTKEGPVGLGGSGSIRSEGDHSGHYENNPRSDDAIATLATEAKTKPRPKMTRKHPTVVEVYGGGAICDEALRLIRSLNIEGLDAMDLRAQKPEGSSWNFCR